MIFNDNLRYFLYCFRLKYKVLTRATENLNVYR